VVLNSNTFIYDRIRDRKSVAVLIDPEKCADRGRLLELLNKAEFAGIDFLFVGGSSVVAKDFHRVIGWIREGSRLPMVIFPGSGQQLTEKADAILYLSLLSGRNPDFLIGHHVQTAIELFEMDIEVIPTGYLLIDGGALSSVAYMSQTTPIPRDHLAIVRQTAMAAKLLGKKLLFLDAGSGARFTVPLEMISDMKKVGLPILIGGGVRSIQSIREMHDHGANVVVIGNRLEEDMDLLLDIRNYLLEITNT
jgi:putative glycerol-1-phosphate prenyltransferase